MEKKSLQMENSQKNQPKQLEDTKSDSEIELAYWPFRGKGHIVKLVLEYLEIPYKQKIYQTPSEWYSLKNKQEARWRGVELPYIKDGDNIITEPIPIITYILKKYGHSELLGVGLRDTATIDMFLWSTSNMTMKIMGMIWKQCGDSNLDKINILAIWKTQVQPRLKQFENFPQFSDFYLGYFSIADICLYEFANGIQKKFPDKMQMFPKIRALQKRISKLENIRKYEESIRASPWIDPIKQKLCMNMQFHKPPKPI